MTAPTGWSTLYNMVPGGNLRRAGCFYKVADGSEVSMRPTSGNASEWSLIGLAIRGVREIPEVSAMVAATTAAPDPAAVSPSWGNKRAMFIAAVHTLHNSAVPVSALPAGYGNLTMCNNTGTAKGTVSFGNRIARTASEDPAAFTMVSSAVCVPATIALR
ncbi:hypothetical protein [Kaistia sp. MMO-174]|uniref:hypothetical protein n=1 Tax=Kaistia sp. MMO-174 TaxID=3081256 RepID=UPI00301B1998